MTKICTICKEEKDLTEFSFRNKKLGRLESRCKKCVREKSKIYSQDPIRKEKKALQNKKWVENNREIVREKRRIYYQKIKEKQKAYYKIYNKQEKAVLQQAKYREKNRERIHEYQREHYRKNKKTISERHIINNKKRYKTDPIYKLRRDQGRRIRKALKANRELKNKNTPDYLGCTIKFLKEYLESQFTENMSWIEFFQGKIHIDHKIPCASFDLTDPEQQKKCFHYSNLQPLWWYDNLSKRDKLDHKVS